MKKNIPYLLVVLLVIVVITSSKAMLAELSAVRFFYNHNAYQKTMLDKNILPFARSERGRLYVLLGCEQALYNKNVPEKTAIGFAKACFDYSQSITQKTPDTLSYYVAALSALTLPQNKTWEQAYVLSYAIGKNEGWVARKRFLLLQSRYNNVPPPLQKVFAHDIQTLIRGSSGVDFLINRYMHLPALRNSISSAIKTMQGAQKERFLQRLNHAFQS